jgi:hypothetical protein
MRHLLLLLPLLAGCYQPSFTATHYTCDVSNPYCPDGTACIEGWCGGPPFGADLATSQDGAAPMGRSADMGRRPASDLAVQTTPCTALPLMSGCGPSEYCYVFGSEMTDCQPAGSNAPGAACSGPFDCRPGYACLSVNEMPAACYALCMGNQNCTSPSQCYSYPGWQQYGFCA